MLPLKTLKIEQSWLYRLGRKRDLAGLLDLSVGELKALSTDENFKEWTKKGKNGAKDRLIEQPHSPLKTALSKLHRILRSVETPPWLMSGKRNIKPRDNAEVHRYNGYMLSVDIAKFYQSTRREFVYLTFKNDFQQTDDVASLLANLVTYKGHIPTGTSTSQLIAFWAYRRTFERIHKLCASNGIIMTVWVDDVTFSSSKPFPKNWEKDIGKIVNSVALSLKHEKTKEYLPLEYKVATGSAISPTGEIRVKNQKRKEIIDILKGRRVETLPLKIARALFGKLTSQRQNEGDFFPSVHMRCKKRVQKLQKRRVSQKKLKLPVRA
jgi:RNA-directed DNA polymerase